MQWPHVAAQLMRLVLLWHLPLLSFLAHLRSAHRPSVSAHPGERSGPVDEPGEVVQLNMSPVQLLPYIGRHVVRPASTLTQSDVAVSAVDGSMTVWQAQNSVSGGDGGGGGDGCGGGGGGDGGGGGGGGGDG